MKANTICIAALALAPLAMAHSPAIRRHHARHDSPFIKRAGGPEPSDAVAAEASLSASAAAAAAAASSAMSSSAGTTSATSSSQSTGVSSQSSSATSSAASSSPSTFSQTSTSQIQSSSDQGFTAPTTSTPSSSSTSTTTTSTLDNNAPTTISVPSSSSTTTHTTTTITKSSAVVSSSKSSSASASASSAASNSSSTTSSGGISKPALIAIIVVAVVVGLIAAGWTAFRKWKLKPSNRFDARMKPIDFSPNNNDAFIEKTLHRTASNSSADRQRQQFVAELDNSLTAGVPEHDFTATGNSQPNYDMYNADPYAHTAAYEYGHQGNEHVTYPPTAATEHITYPPAADHGAYPPAPADHSYNYDYPTQDSGYADVQRNQGTGNGAGYLTETFPASEFELGRPTGGAEGPYAQAATYRGY